MWSSKDIEKLKAKGLKVEQDNVNRKSLVKIPKVDKGSVGKNTIELLLQEMKRLGVIRGYVKELKFDDVRRFRFDWAIPDLKLAIEYEGLNSEKSRHTTKKGYTGDCQKYNIATLNGWKVLRYTALNYSEFAQDIRLFLRKL